MYLWLVALHLISIVCWFAALFYLPRLFVYHAISDDRISIDRFVLMERKLYYLIANPAMFGTLGFGIWLYLQQVWFVVKTGLVLLLIGYHHICLSYMKKLADDNKRKTDKFFRVFNEIPVVFLIIIIILAIVKPF